MNSRSRWRSDKREKVKHYMTVLMQKLNARNRVEVVIAAQKLSGYERPRSTL